MLAIDHGAARGEKLQLQHTEHTDLCACPLACEYANRKPPFLALRGRSRPTGEIGAGKPLTPIPSIELTDVDQKILPLGDNVVFLSITETSAQPRDLPLLIMKATVNALTCCRAANCEQLKVKMQIECDCSHKDAALCAVPTNGYVGFHDVRVNKMGQHKLSYRHVEIMPDGTVKTYTFTDSESFTIIPGNTEGLQIVTNPQTVMMGNITGDEPALLDPQPVCGYTDDQLNTIPMSSETFVMAIPCLDFSDTRIESLPPRLLDPPRYCPCNDTACHLQLKRVRDVQSFGGATFGGNLIGRFDSIGMARFTDLNTRLARNDLRVICRFTEPDEARLDDPRALADPLFAYILSQDYVITSTFVVYPGRLQRLMPLVGPGNYSGCARCQHGVHLLLGRLQATVQLLDSADNELVACTPASRFCRGAPTAMIKVRLYDADDNVVDNQPEGNLQGIIEVDAVQGKAYFNEVRVRSAGKGYYLRFHSQGTDFKAGGLTSTNIIHADSEPFAVVNGAPAVIDLDTAAPLIGADAEVFQVQPVLFVRDAGGNIVYSDCYNDCAETIGEQCALVSSDTPDSCASAVEVSLVAANDATLFGTTTVIARGGVVVFTDLGIDSGGDCYPPAPYPNYMIQMSLVGIDDLPIDVPVKLERRVSKLIFVDQPKLSVALETFSTDVVVQVVNCVSDVVPTATGSISIGIRDDAGEREPGVLTGSTRLRVERGQVTFSDLSIQSEGVGYTLIISYHSLAVVPDVLSALFNIEPAVVSIQLLISPTGAVKAGDPFASQPSVILRDFQNNVVLNSKAKITASIGDNPGKMQAWDYDQSILHGARVVSAANGKASFKDLALHKASRGQELASEFYTLVFVFRSMRTVTAYFSVIPNAWADLLIEPSTHPVTTKAGQPFPRHVRVLLVDAFKNKLQNGTVPAGTYVDVLVETPLTRLGSYMNSDPVLLKHGCHEICQGSRPVVCTTCSDKRLNAQSGDVLFTDLRLDMVGQGYRLTFTCESFNQTSEAFDVTHANASYLHVATQPSPECNADKELIRQPAVSVHDKFGNLIMADGVVIEARLTSRERLLPRAAGFPPVPGQEPNTICRVSDVPMTGTRFLNATGGVANFTDLAVRPAMSGFKLEFFGTSSRGVLSINSSEFTVEAGIAVGICNMTLPRRCSALSPCLGHTTIACVDAHGNVQPTCSTCIGDRCNIRPYGTLPMGMNLACHGMVCVSILAPSFGTLRQGSGRTSGINCAQGLCGASINPETGFATFTQLVLDIPSPDYVLKFSTFVVEKRSRLIYEWSYVTPSIENLPGAPILTSATFSMALNSIALKFDRPTSMNNLSDTCKAVIDEEFQQSLGANPSCTWTSKSEFLIVPGIGAYANQSTRVLLSKASNIVYDDVFVGVHMESGAASTINGTVVEGIVLPPVFLSLPHKLVKPDATILGAQELSACDLLDADASLSSGSASRPFKDIHWSVDYDETYLYQGLLTSAGTVYKFFKSSIHFSTMLPNMINTVTITLRPSAQVHANSTISITGIPPYYPSSRGCPASPYELSQPCVEDSCRLLELEGPSAFLFSSHLKPNLLEVPVSWWQVGVSRLFASIDFHLPTGITLDEFSMVLQETGDYVGTVQALHRFQTADVDSDNSISEEEFINNRPISFQTFSAMDIDTSGLLDPTELKTALQSSGDFVNDKQINALFQGLDSNQNGLVSEDEFKAAPVLVMNARHLQYRPAAFQGLHGGLSLHVHESHFLSSSSDTVIRFKIQNPPLPWDTQPITIQSKCTECICMNYEICDVKTSQIFEAQAMKMDCSGPRCKSDAEFNVENPFVSISGSMTETSRVNGARNVLTLGFNTSHVLPPKSGIVIKGLPLAWQLPLAGSTSGREKVIDVCLIGPSAKYFACLSCPNKARARAAGRWFTEVGEIHLQVNFGGSLSTDYHEVSWNFYNPTNMMRTACKSTDIPGSVMESAECPSAVRPTLHVSYDYARAAADCNVDPALCVPGTEAMTPASKGINHGVLGAGESAAWSRAQVSESNSFAEFVSHLLIEVEANVELFQMTTINVSGFPSQRRPMGRSEKCMSEIGSGSLDCWAGCHGEEFACEDGYIASVSRNESRMIMGQSCLKYTCLPQSACSASMCAGHQVNGGHQCWACDEDSLSCLSGYTVLGMTGKALVQSNGAVCREYVCCKESIPVSWNPTKHAVLPLSGVIAQDGNMLECFDDASVAWNNDGTELLWRIQHTDSSQNCYVPSRSTLRFAIPIVNPSMKSEFDDFALSIRAEHHGCTDCVLDACACSDAASSPTRPWNLPPVLLQRSILTAQDGKKSFQPLLTSSHYLDLVRPTISESNSVAGQFATITMSFRPTFAMLAGSNITISGLRPSATATTDNFPVQNSLGLVRTARFEADTGTLLFSLVNVSSANSVFSVSFVLKHVSTAAAAENKTVRATIKTPVCLHEKNSHCAWLSQVAQGEPVDIVEQHKQLTGSALGIHEQRAMRIHKVSETTQVVGALNIITVDLQANFEMFPGYTLTLTSIAGNKMSSIIEAGLTAVPTRLSLFPNCSCVTGFEHVCTTCTSAGQKANLVQFRVWQPDHFFGSPIFQESTGSPMSGTVDGAWIPAESGDKEAGNTLKIVVKKLVPAERLWKFAFVLRNPGLSGLKPKISISDNASQPIISGQSLNGTVFSGVQKDCAFTSVSMQEDSSILSVQTNITLSFISNCPLISLSALSQGATITISGLKGYETPSGISVANVLPSLCPL
jgi:Ca2+-binding EF-hand superfamily protein